MNTLPDDITAHLNALDDQPVNRSSTPPLFALGRRTLLKGGLSAGLLSALGLSLGACQRFAQPLLGFTGIPVQLDPHFDRIEIAPGYTASAFFSWGDPVVAGAKAWHADASDTWEDQLLQAGDNHDGMHYFPFPDAPNSHGLLVINHEYVNRFLHPESKLGYIEGRRPLHEVKKEQAAHGLSIIEVMRNANGQWQRVTDSRYNRRISAFTPMQISGPLAGDAAMKTAADSSGREVLGTLNNCSMGFTPWGTYLACEENWHNYFINRNAEDYAARISHRRYGVATTRKEPAKDYSWETADPRFDATPDASQQHNGYVNEPHRFGWVVEIDPFNPQFKPIKRTALGRYCRECAVVSLGENGRMAIYSGDDTKGEYIYKFVPVGTFDVNNPTASRDFLDHGTLHVAKFLPNGEGQWLALEFGKNGLTPQNGFNSQQEVLLNTRAAADQAGATPMDRPEWVAIHPTSRDVYVSLTNNDQRGDKVPVDAVNPRHHNLHGQIVRWKEKNADPTATEFDWELFLLAGERADTTDDSGKPVTDNLVGNIKGDIFSSPDGMAFDNDGRLWIETDYGDDEPQNHAMGCNQLLCADPLTREVRRFLVGPRGCEITGITFTPDCRSMWINIQHPGISFPASDGKTRPRSTTVLITKDDGGVIGT